MIHKSGSKKKLEQSSGFPNVYHVVSRRQFVRDMEKKIPKKMLQDMTDIIRNKISKKNLSLTIIYLMNL